MTINRSTYPRINPWKETPDALVQTPTVKIIGVEGPVTSGGKAGESKDPRAVEALVKALKDKDRNVREAAAGSLGMIRDERVILPARVQLEVGINSRCLELLRRCGEFDSC